MDFVGNFFTLKLRRLTYAKSLCEDDLLHPQAILSSLKDFRMAFAEKNDFKVRKQMALPK